MLRLTAPKILAAAVLAVVLCPAARAAEPDPCTGFKWDMSRELAVMRQTPQAITAAVKPGAAVPQLRAGTLYSLKLADQAAVTFAAGPGKTNGAGDAHAGLVHFNVKEAGRYRVSIASGLWVDFVDAGQLVPAVDFQGHVGCERPRKIVEFDLPAQRTLTLQFSGSGGAEVTVAITAAGTP